MNEKESPNTEAVWLTAKAAAAHLSVSTRTLRNWVDSGALRRYRMAERRVYRYLRSDLDALFAGDQDEGPALADAPKTAPRPDAP